MRISRVGTVAAGAAGAVATVAALGSAALGKTSGQPLITIGVGSAVNAAAWQVCGSDAVAGLGGTGAVGSSHTVVGDCANSNTWLKQDVQPGLISILDDTSVDVASWQVCGSHVVAGVGATVAHGSPAMVAGNCLNANTFVEGPDGAGEPGLVSVLSGSAVDVMSWQVCGSSAVMGLGAIVASSSPTSVLGDCTNAGALIEPRRAPAALPLLSNVPLNLLPLQVCETNGQFNSPALVGGSCSTPTIVPQP